MADQELLMRLEEIKARFKTDPSAMDEMDSIAENMPSEARVWEAMAYMHARVDRLDLAIDAVSRAMNLDPDEPAYFFKRANYLADINDYAGVIGDAARGVEVSDRTKFDYYRESLVFLSAYAHIRMGQLALAREELLSLSDRNIRTWVHELVTWHGLAVQCGIAIGIPARD